VVTRILVANRGEIACRILRTLREMGLPSVALVSDAEPDAPHAALADDVVPIGPAESYLDVAAVVGAARQAGAGAIHPGYGYLSQSAAFVRACDKAGLVFIGPTAEAMVALGDKRGSRRTAETLGIPVIPGEQDVDRIESAREAAARVEYPVLLKAAGGGGGRGMRLVREPARLEEAFESARREALSSFADARLLVEKYVSPARHVEVQILGDGREAVAVGERECSLQRRYQKVVEEGPCLSLTDRTRREMFDAAVRLARGTGYRNAATVEFLLGPSGQFWFLEVNTRLQVEHPVTEMLTGLDLVRAQVELALGGPLPAPPSPRGHAIEVRINAEDPYRGFLPQAGRVLMLSWPHRPAVRVDSGLREGQDVGPQFDPLLAKMIAWGADRESARRKLIDALREAVVLGVVTNQAFLLQVLESDLFARGETFTTTLESTSWTEPPPPPEALAAARQVLSGSGAAASAPGADGAADRYSPWQHLGGFRLGG
jgi:acetyl/propionyl-CoA carboxylase alpha subunit